MATDKYGMLDCEIQMSKKEWALSVTAHTVTPEDLEDTYNPTVY